MKKVVVGLSGGVDSAVTAYLLKKAGYEVHGMTMLVWRREEERPLGRDERSKEDALREDLGDAEKMARFLDIPLHIMDIRDRFYETVVLPFLETYLSGETPNPCVLCNPMLKFHALESVRKEIGADYIATGHYAEVVKKGDRYALRKDPSQRKDQTYALYRLPQEVLSRVLFPLGKMDKTEVRKIAEEAGIPVAHKKDSQELCFLPDQDRLEFLKDYKNLTGKSDEGYFVLEDGTRLGKHKGFSAYTIGQRKGLGIAYKEPLFVLRLDSVTGDVVLGTKEGLRTREVMGRDIAYMGEASFPPGLRCRAKVRYNQEESPASVISSEGGILHVEFDDAVYAPSPGQHLVLYDLNDRTLLGGAIITNCEKS